MTDGYQYEELKRKGKINNYEIEVITKKGQPGMYF